MPELPDVEGFRRHFKRYASDRRIERVEVRDPTLVRNTSAQGLARALKRKRFAAPHRHGKFLFAEAEDTTVVMHFGMTGLLHWTADSEYRHQHDRVIFWLEPWATLVPGPKRSSAPAATRSTPSASRTSAATASA